MRDFTGSIPVLVAPIHKYISAKIIRVYAPLMSGNYRETRADARHLSRHHVSGADVHKKVLHQLLRQQTRDVDYQYLPYNATLAINCDINRPCVNWQPGRPSQPIRSDKVPLVESSINYHNSVPAWYTRQYV